MEISQLYWLVLNEETGELRAGTDQAQLLTMLIFFTTIEDQKINISHINVKSIRNRS